MDDSIINPINIYITYEKIFKEIGWKPQYEILEGLKETIEFYKKLKEELNIWIKVKNKECYLKYAFSS